MKENDDLTDAELEQYIRDNFIDTKSICKHLGISRTQLYDYINKGMPVTRLEKNWYHPDGCKNWQRQNIMQRIR